MLTAPREILLLAIANSLLLVAAVECAELPPPRPLWPNGGFKYPIKYQEDEKVRKPEPPPTSPSRSNRVFSYVSKPTYSIHRAPESLANGVGLVICPGGGYRDVWLDREGHDLAIWLKARGVSSLVLKYRTNTARKYAWEQYLPAVEEDARQAIRILRRSADDLQIDPQKIGIGGFSAGGNLALRVALYPDSGGGEDGISGEPNFAGLFYPWLREDYAATIHEHAATIPPLFIMNASDDGTTPTTRCVDFYTKLLSAGVKAEFHIFGKGGHGFDLGDGRGKSASLWKNSFVAWLADSKFIE